MPTYEYRCKSCGEKHELFHSIHADPEKVCPACGESTLERMISSGAGIIFKGSGFYETDYKRDKAPACQDKSTQTQTPSSSTTACCQGGSCSNHTPQSPS